MAAALTAPYPRNERARRLLRAELAPGVRLFTIVRSVSRSRASAEFDVLYIDEDANPAYVTEGAALALGCGLNPGTGHLVVHAVDLPEDDMDVETAGACLVANLSMTLYGDPYALEHGTL